MKTPKRIVTALERHSSGPRSSGKIRYGWRGENWPPEELECDNVFQMANSVLPLRAVQKGLAAGVVMSLGYFYVFAAAARAQSEGYTFAQDPVNNPNAFTMAMYFACQLAGLSLLAGC